MKGNHRCVEGQVVFRPLCLLRLDSCLQERVLEVIGETDPAWDYEGVWGSRAEWK